MRDIMQRVIEVHCSCGGVVSEVDTIPKEEMEYGCSRLQCCVRAWECSVCKVRFTLALEAPEAFIC